MSKIEENINEWHIWAINHGHTPKRHSKDKEEDRIAANISRIYNRMKKRPDKYASEIVTYESVYKEYNDRNLVCDNALVVFEKWKLWLETNKRLPKVNSVDMEEQKLVYEVDRMIKNLKKIKLNNTEIIDEYQRICKDHAKDRIIERSRMDFDVWKFWVEVHKRLPHSNSEDGNERKMYSLIYKVLKTLKKYGVEKEVEEEYKRIRSEYKK